MFKIFCKETAGCLKDGITGKELEYKTMGDAEEAARKHKLLYIHDRILTLTTIDCDAFSGVKGEPCKLF